MSFFDDAALAEIRGHAFRLECLKMVLTRQASGEVAYTGGGELRQTQEGDLEFILYDTTTSPSTYEFRSIPSGTLLDENYFYRWEAVDLYGNTWNADWVDANPSLSVDQPGAVVRGRVREVSSVRDLEHQLAGFVGFAPTPASVPVNQYTVTSTKRGDRESSGFHMDVWYRALEGLGELQVRRLDSGIDVSFTGLGPALPPNFEVRLEEALTFVLGAPIKWQVMQELENGRLRRTVRRRSRLRGRPRLQPPTRTTIMRPEAGDLFRRYLGHLISTAPPADQYHPLAATVSRVLRASSSDIEDEALVLAVELETILGQHYKEHGSSSPDERRIVDELVAYAKAWVGPAGFRSRLIGAVERFGASTPIAKLRALRDKAILEPRHVEAWNKARNRAAHGQRGGAQIHESIAECNLMYEALLLLIFDVVGYDGEFPDYTTPDWPQRRQPRLQQHDAAAAKGSE